MTTNESGATPQETATATVKRNRNGWETFIKTFNESDSYKEVAEKLGIGVSSVQVRASKYRKNGVQLKKMARVAGGGAGAKLDWDKMKTFANGLVQSEPEQVSLTAADVGTVEKVLGSSEG